jgi:hypothetical protein
MWSSRGRWRRALGHEQSGRSCATCGLALLAVAAIALTGCANDPSITGSIPQAGPQSIAFESIDGPPKPVFDRLVASLSAEAEARKLPVVSRTGHATLRVRAYLATHVHKKEATLSWIWDVFDAGSQRVFRLTGQEPLGPARRDVWAQCDDALLARVAAKGFEALSARLGGGAPPAPIPASEPPGGGPQTVASADLRR